MNALFKSTNYPNDKSMYAQHMHKMHHKGF